MQATTVKLQKSTKYALDELRGERETYDELIRKLLAQAKNKALKGKLEAAYKSLGGGDLKELQEWESASAEVE